MNRTGVVTDPIFLKHDQGPYHPECPQRLVEIGIRIEDSGLAERLSRVDAREASQEEICLVHSGDYYRHVASSEGRSVALDPDTHTSPDSFRAALKAAGGALALTEQVVKGSLDNGFALVRPPGHHAERAQARGFCLFNNIAICAEHARQALGLERILIIDWDLHHGNGTMHSFWDRKDVLYMSTHQYPFYPGTGALQDVGQGDGEGHTISVPLPGGMGDHEYAAIFRDVFAPIAAAYKPDLVLISAGFDTLSTDPLGSMRMSPEGYGTLTKQILDMAQATASGKVVITLEGGYDVAAQAVAVENVLKVLLGEIEPPPVPEGQGLVGPIVEAVRKIQSPYWKF